MSKEIRISQNCSLNCMALHRNTGRDHRVMETRRFKTRFNEFLSQDDQEWQEGFEKVELIEEIMKDFKDEYQSRMIEKKLMYALNYDTEGKFFKLFSLANNDQFDKLSCQDVALIENRMEKGRTLKPAEIKSIIKETLQEVTNRLKSKIDRILNNNIENGELKRETVVKKVEEPRRTEREARGNRGRQEQEKSEVNSSFRDNGLATIKMNQVVGHSSPNFNIKVKILGIKKIFSLGEGNKKKIQFEGADETGVAPVVVDSLRFIKEGAVIFISNAKVYSFHGNKQIQQSLKASYVQQLPNESMQVSDQQIFGGRRRRERGNYEKKQTSELSSNKNSGVQNRVKTKKYYQPKNKPFNKTSRQEKIYTRPQRADQQERREYRRREYSRRREFSNSPEKEQKIQKVVQTQNSRRRRERQAPKVEKPRKKENSDSSDQQEEEVKQESRQLPARVKKEEQIANNKKKPTKIKDIQPGDENINIIAEIIEIREGKDYVDKKCLLCVIGDETGLIEAELPQFNLDIKTHVVLFLEDVEAAVHDQSKRLLIKLSQESMVQRTTIRMPSINMDVNMSLDEWAEEQEQEEKQKPVVEDF